MDSNIKTNGKISYSYNTNKLHLMPLVVRDCLIGAAEKTPDRVGFIEHKSNTHISFSSLKEKVNILGQNFLHLNLKKAERVAVILPNCADYIYSYYACSYIGALIAPLSVNFGVDSLSHIFDNLSPSAVIIDYSGQSKEVIDKLLPDINQFQKGEYKSSRYPSLRHIIVAYNQNDQSSPNYWNFSELYSKNLSNRIYELPEIDTDDGFAILFTSGTTGRPKGVHLTNFTVANNSLIYANPDEKFEESKTDIACYTGQMFHLSFISHIMGNLGTNRKTVIPSHKFDLELIFECIQKHKCNSLGGMPKKLNSIIESSWRKTHDFSSVKIMNWAGTHCPNSLIEKVFNETSIHLVTSTYGMSEIGGIALSFTPKGSEICTQRFRINVPYLEKKIVDPETGKIVPFNTEGLLHVRGFTVTNGYWNDPENTAKALDRNNWFNTGDVFTMNEEGVLFFIMRSVDKIVVKTPASTKINVNHFNVEEVLLKHENVMEAAVFGIKVNEFEQRLCAWIILRSDEIATTVDNIRDFCKENLSEHEIPVYINFCKILPENAHGKILRTEMERVSRVEFGF